jgi:hypothetical protein
MQIYQVNPWHVDIGEQPYFRDIRAQALRLAREGQIEPVTVRRSRNPWLPLRLDPSGWFYAAAQVAAAREQEWPAILITY